MFEKAVRRIITKDKESKQKWASGRYGVRSFRSRFTAVTTAVCMVAAMLNSPAFAAQESTAGTGSICPHHIHNDECGYSEGYPCSHECTDECYREVERCIHVHAEECYSEGEDEPGKATSSNSEEREPDICTHECTLENGCIKRIHDCGHRHDGSCGYEAGNPCTYDASSCGICSSEEGQEERVHNGGLPAGGEKVEEVCAMIDALPAIDSIYENIFDEGEPEFMDWLEQMQETVKAIKAAKAAFEALSERDKALIDAERADKLLELAGLTEIMTMEEPGTDMAAYIGNQGYATLQEAFDAAVSTDPDEPTIIELCKDLKFGTSGDITESIGLLDGRAVKLTSRSGETYTISRAADGTGDYFFKVYDDSTLILEDVVLSGENITTGGSDYFVAVAGAELILEDGAILEKNTSSAIRVGTRETSAISAVTMNGGIIRNNSASGIRIQPNFSTASGKTLQFTMNGGLIENNVSADSGAGVYATNSSLNCTAKVMINDGEIRQNESAFRGDTVKGGGGIYCDSEFFMDGGTISGNSAQVGGGIYLSSGITEARITGGSILDNDADGMDDVRKGKGENIYVNGAKLAVSPQEDLTSVFLYQGASLLFPSALEHTVTLEGAYKVNANMIGLLVGAGDGYTLTKTDLGKLRYKDNAYGFKLEGNQIKLAEVPWNITYTLTNMTASNQPVTIDKNTMLSTKITAADGYKLPGEDTIAVTMGGTALSKGSMSGYMLGTADNGRSYTIGIYKVTGDVVITAGGVKQGSDASLSALTYYVSGLGDVAVPGFSSSAENPVYNVVLPASVSNTAMIYVDKIKNDKNAVSSSDPGYILLSDGGGQWKVTITSEDGTVSNTYTVNFIKSSVQPAFTADGAVYEKIGQDQNTAVFTLASAPDDSTAFKVYSSLDEETELTSVTAAADGTALTLTGVSGVKTDTDFYISSVEQNRAESVRTKVTVKRCPVNNDASLSNLMLSNGTLAPVFESEILEYAAVVEGSVADLMVIPAVSDTGKAGVKVNGTDTVSGEGRSVALNVGENTITILVTAEDGATTKTYTITVTRQAEYGISLTQKGEKIFTEVEEGYGEQLPFDVTINNTGNQETGELSVSLSGTYPGSFAVSGSGIGSIPVDGRGSFTVKPVAGLPAGTYKATVSVSGNNGISAGFPVSFTVSKRPDEEHKDTSGSSGGDGGDSYSDSSYTPKPETVVTTSSDETTVRVNVILPKSMDSSGELKTVGVTIEKGTVEEARQNGKKLEAVVREASGAVKMVWSLNGQDIKNAAGSATDLYFGIRTAPIQSYDPMAVTVKPSVNTAGYENGLVMDLMISGTFLVPAKLTVPAINQTGIAARTLVSLYRYDKTTGEVIPVTGTIYMVDENGNVTIDFPAGTHTGVNEYYIILPVPAQEDVRPENTAALGKGAFYRIEKGDTLIGISRRSGCRLEDLLALNPGVNPYDLQIGSFLEIPAR